jgi:hypothetical protein
VCSLTAAEQEFIALSWRLIEWKVAYYKGDLVNPARRADYEVSDDEYDAAEVRYLTLCRKLNRRNTIVHKGWPGFEDVGTEHAMMEVDESRPSVRLVIAKLSSPKRKGTK